MGRARVTAEKRSIWIAPFFIQIDFITAEKPVSAELDNNSPDEQRHRSTLRFSFARGGNHK
jgi:hypothetical protein